MERSAARRGPVVGQHRMLLIALPLVMIAASCRITDHSEKDPNAIDANALEIPASGYAPGDTMHLPRFRMDSTTKVFGRVSQGTVVERVFQFTNVGGSDLIIADVRGTCGCTVGKDWPRQPVHPGESGTITITFDSEGRSGLQEKTITITANTQPPTTVLLLKGEVVAPPGSAPAE